MVFFRPFVCQLIVVFKGLQNVIKFRLKIALRNLLCFKWF